MKKAVVLVFICGVFCCSCAPNNDEEKIKELEATLAEKEAYIEELGAEISELCDRLSVYEGADAYISPSK